MVAGQRWTVRDRYSNDIYLTEERWEHIIDLENHPETDHILLRITRHDKKAVSFVE
ncbi:MULTISPECIES: hypothetical protein [unclassified Coleofasciculus]|uniref:hypothetical protein n=1 Tax=unclassified Coleofasciculus TaxID=2692782 RepID=UPI0018801924|nr:MULTISPECIES: hypothetical protein [unclassified Coleofasciculus]MBE9128647.1 hypothetical protein [Coleofasciculus sp. LEGE 07081]MBE9149758.1 hypothetical protein [Coleofasciculus sp. LEGE 07092]